MAPLPEHLVQPPFSPTYNLSKSTMVQACASSNDPQALLAARHWGIVSYDWSSRVHEWHHDHPMDSDVLLVDQAAQAAAVAPDTKFWIYRNLVIAYAEFAQVRALEPICHEASPGIFARRWSKANVTMDCNTWEAQIVPADPKS